MTTIALDDLGWHVATADSIVTTGIDGDLPYLLDRAAREFGAAGDGVLILSESAAKRAGHHRASLPVPAGPWRARQVGSWSTWEHATKPRIHVAVAEWVHAEHARANPLIDPADLVVSAFRHEWFREVTGIRFAYSAGTTMCDWVMRHSWTTRAARPAWRDLDLTPLVDGSPSVALWRWESDRQIVGRHIHQWDKNASFLGTLGNAQVAVGRLTHTGQTGFNPALAGLWQVIPGLAPVTGLPHPAGTALPASEPVWLPTATMRLLGEEGCCPRVLDSWTCPDTRALFRPLKDRWNAARVELKGSRDPDARAVLAAVKGGYAAGVNQLGTERGGIVRADWRAEIIGLDKANIWRAARRGAAQGWWPLAIKVDALWYACDQSDPQCPPMLRDDPIALGAWKHAGVTAASEWGGAR